MHFSKVFILWGVQLIVEPGHEIYNITHGIYINNFHCYVTYYMYVCGLSADCHLILSICVTG